MAKANDKIVSQMIEDLVSMGQETVDIMKFDKKWTFKLITSGEYLKILKNSSDYRDELTRMFKMQMEILTYALISINDISLNDDDKKKLFEKVNPTIINTLYQEFVNFRSKKDDVLFSLDKKKETAPTNNVVIEN